MEKKAAYCVALGVDAKDVDERTEGANRTVYTLLYSLYTVQKGLKRSSKVLQVMPFSIETFSPFLIVDTLYFLYLKFDAIAEMSCFSTVFK